MDQLTSTSHSDRTASGKDGIVVHVHTRTARLAHTRHTQPHRPCTATAPHHYRTTTAPLPHHYRTTTAPSLHRRRTGRLPTVVFRAIASLRSARYRSAPCGRASSPRSLRSRGHRHVAPLVTSLGSLRSPRHRRRNAPTRLANLRFAHHRSTRSTRASSRAPCDLWKIAVQV